MRSALVVLLALGLCAPAEAKVVCDPYEDGHPPVVLGDVDNDNQADLAVGLPGSRQVYVDQTHAADVTLGSGAHGFGRAVAVGDLDGPGEVLLRGRTVELPTTGRQVIAVAESGSAL